MLSRLFALCNLLGPHSLIRFVRQIPSIITVRFPKFLVTKLNLSGFWTWIIVNPNSLHFTGFIFMPFSTTQFLTVSRLFCKFSMSILFAIFLCIESYTWISVISFNSCLPTLKHCVRLTQTTTFESTSQAASFVRTRSWGIKWKPLDKSIIIASIPIPSSKELAMSWHSVMTWFSHEYFSLNPFFPSYTQSFLSHVCLKYPAITCSSCLQTTEVKLMGL